jgi:hypothetical protein
MRVPVPAGPFTKIWTFKDDEEASGSYDQPRRVIPSEAIPSNVPAGRVFVGGGGGGGIGPGGGGGGGGLVDAAHPTSAPGEPASNLALAGSVDKVPVVGSTHGQEQEPKKAGLLVR